VTSNEIFQVGVARADITPQPGISLMGYTVREGFSHGVHMPLTATALVVDGVGGRVAIIAIDCAALLLGFAHEVRSRCGEALGVSVEGVLINFSHTHSSPPPPEWAPYQTKDQLERQAVWARQLLDGCVSACQQAAGSMRTARLAVGWGECRGNINRRQKTDDGQVLLGEDASAPSDHTVAVLRFDDLDGRPIAIAYRYSCHTVTLGPRTNVISPDFVGPARQLIERELACPSLFLQGCAGNQNPATGIGQDREGADDTVRLGHMLGGEVLKVCAGLRTHRQRTEPRLVRSVAVYWLYEYEKIEPGGVGSVNARAMESTLPLAPFPELKGVQREADEWLLKRREAEQRNATEAEQNVNQRFTWWAERRLSAACAGTNPINTTFPLQSIRIGPVEFVAIPFEVMSETGMDLRSASPAPHTLVLGYSNGIVSYLPTPTISREGGMEAKLGYKAYLVPSEIPGDWEPRICQDALRLIERNRS